MKKSKQPAAHVRGFTKVLPGNRSVFVGTRPGETNWYLKFKNGDDHTRIVLTNEAMTALLEMRECCFSGGATWQIDEPAV